MPNATLSTTVDQPTVAEIRQFIITGNFTTGSGIAVQVTLDLKNEDGSMNRTMSFELDNAAPGQLDHFISDVASAMSTINAKVEEILGVTFV